MVLAASAAINTVPDFKLKTLEITAANIMRPRTRHHPPRSAVRCGLLLGDLKKPERLIVVNRDGQRQAILKKG
jgi:hypothetical protein